MVSRGPTHRRRREGRRRGRRKRRPRGGAPWSRPPWRRRRRSGGVEEAVVVAFLVSRRRPRPGSRMNKQGKWRNVVGLLWAFSFGPLGITNKPGPNWIPSTLRLGPSPPPPPLPSLPPPRAAGSAAAASAAHRLLSAGASARSSELSLEGGRCPISPRGPAPPACPLADAADVGEHQLTGWVPSRAHWLGCPSSASVVRFFCFALLVVRAWRTATRWFCRARGRTKDKGKTRCCHFYFHLLFGGVMCDLCYLNCQDGKKIKEDPKMSKSKLKKLQKLEVRLPSWHSFCWSLVIVFMLMPIIFFLSPGGKAKEVTASSKYWDFAVC